MNDSELEIITVSKNMGDGPVIAEVKVLVKNKIYLWLKVFKSQKGHLYVKLPTIKIKDQWEPAIAFVDPEVEKKLTFAISDLLKTNYSL